MPKIKSAKKALRQSIRRKERNVARKKEFRKVIKTFKNLVTEKKLEEAKKQISLVYEKLDKAAKANLIKKNTASRLKSRLSKLLNRV